MMNDKENIPSFFRRKSKLEKLAFINGVKSFRAGKNLELDSAIEEQRAELERLSYSPKHISNEERIRIEHETDRLRRDIQKMQEARRCGMEMAAVESKADIYDLLSEYAR